MADQTRAKERVTLGGWMGAVSLIVSLAVAVANVLVIRHYQKLTVLASEQFAEVNAKVRAIELSVAETRNSLRVQEQAQSGSTIEALKILESIKPKPELSLRPPGQNFYVNGNNTILSFDMKNAGDFSFAGGSLEIILSSTQVSEADFSSPKPATLNYQIKSVDSLGVLAPRSSRLQSAYIYWPSGPPERFFWIARTRVRTDDLIAEAAGRDASPALADKLRAATSTTASVSGEVVIQRGPQTSMRH